MSFDPTKPYKTTGGLEAVILADDMRGPCPLIGYVIGSDGVKEARTWNAEGKRYRGVKDISDLVNVPAEPTTVGGWIDTLPDGYRERAMRMIDNPKEGAKTLYVAVVCLSSWEKSPEGHDFWWAVSEGQLPPLPPEVELVPYTLETWPFWATRARVKGRSHHGYVGGVSKEGVQVASQDRTAYNILLNDYEIAGVDGAWKPAGEEVSQ